MNDLTPAQREAAEKMRKVVHRLDTCDYCEWVITGQREYERHLEREHPSMGSAAH